MTTIQGSDCKSPTSLHFSLSFTSISDLPKKACYRLNEAADAHNYKIFAVVWHKKGLVIQQVGNELVAVGKFFSSALTDQQCKKLAKALANKSPLSLWRVKTEQIQHGATLLLSATQINPIKKAASEKKVV